MEKNEPCKRCNARPGTVRVWPGELGLIGESLYFCEQCDLLHPLECDMIAIDCSEFPETQEAIPV